jgi:hypothetical protein
MHSGANEFLVADESGSDWFVIGVESSTYRDLVDAVRAYVGASYAVVEREPRTPTVPRYADAIADLDAVATRVRVTLENRVGATTGSHTAGAAHDWANSSRAR